jgi:hypothetical protein
MNRRTLLVVPLAAVVTVVITAVASSGSNVRLPLPKPVSASVAAHKTNTGSAPLSLDTGPDQSSGSQTYTTAPPTPLTGCTVTVSNPNPPKSQTAETATVVTTPGAQVRLQAIYSRPITHSGLASTGTYAFPLPISHVPVGHTVQISVTVSLRGVKKTCTTSFTPV